MPRSQRHPRNQSKDEINISPMIDMVFILLIFFIVATVFIDEQGLDTSPTNLGTAESNESPFDLYITANGNITLNQETIYLSAIKPAVVNHLYAKSRDVALVVKAHPDTPSGLLIQVLDQIKAGGVSNVALASRL